MRSELKERLSSDLVTNVTAMCGRRGLEWFDELPAIVSRLEERWSLVVNDPFPGIEYNFVAPATTRNGTAVVVKIAPPFETTEIHGEAKFLKSIDGNGAVRLLEEDRDAKAILIERAEPGRSLVDLFAHDPLASVPPAITVLQGITRDPPLDMTDVPTLDEWFANFRKRHWGTAFPRDVAERSSLIYEELTAVRSDLRYLHGDLHLGNIVDSNRMPFLAIDPKGIVGHTGYDAAVFLINLYRWQRESGDYVFTLINDAVRLFADALGIPEASIRKWCFVNTVIGAWWNFEDMPDLYDPELAMPDIWDV